jgi:hypothetical protein
VFELFKGIAAGFVCVIVGGVYYIINKRRGRVQVLAISNNNSKDKKALTPPPAALEKKRQGKADNRDNATIEKTEAENKRGLGTGTAASKAKSKSQPLLKQVNPLIENFKRTEDIEIEALQNDSTLLSLLYSYRNYFQDKGVPVPKPLFKEMVISAHCAKRSVINMWSHK